MTVNLVISGKVQGVFFRKSAKDEADKLGLVGWIRNRQSLRSSSDKNQTAGLNPDDTVEALAVGPKEKLEEFVSWCRVGPPFAKVKNVEIEWTSEEQQFDDFEVF